MNVRLTGPPHTMTADQSKQWAYQQRGVSKYADSCNKGYYLIKEYLSETVWNDL